jgi:catechol 2,3-dioxygenase-like lactoylglutathione lyase family enzyme
VLDHVTIGVSDLERSRAFYDAAVTPLEIPVTRGEEYYEWGDFSISRSRGRAVTRRAHVAFAARSREHVDAFHRAAVAAGGTDNGAPGLRPRYHKDYYGAFVLDPDGNNIEAVFHGSPGTPGAIDHVTLRVRNGAAADRFYDVVAPGERNRTVFIAEGEPTENIHFAFAAPDNAAVDEFWRVGTEAGFISNGEPGERPEYHRGYYAAFLLDPDGHNVEAVCHNR